MFSTADRQREEKHVTDYLLSNIENILLNGTELILNQVFKLVGFDAIGDDILRHLVTAYPGSHGKVGELGFNRS